MKQLGNYLLIALFILFALVDNGSKLITDTFDPLWIPWVKLIGYIATGVAATVGVKNEYARKQKIKT